MTIWDILLCRFWVHRWDKWSGTSCGIYQQQLRHCQRCNKQTRRWVW